MISPGLGALVLTGRQSPSQAASGPGPVSTLMLALQASPGPRQAMIINASEHHHGREPDELRTSSGMGREELSETPLAERARAAAQWHRRSAPAAESPP